MQSQGFGTGINTQEDQKESMEEKKEEREPANQNRI